MHCPECDAEVPPHREFCPQCGTPTSGALRERRQGTRSPEELRRNRRNVLVIGAAMVAGFAIIGPFSLFGGSIDLGSGEGRRGPLVIEAEQIYEAFRDDSEAADERFDDREMVVSGEFLRIVPDSRGNPDLRFKTSNPGGPLGADLAPISHEAATRLRPGQRVTVSCQRITGNGNDHWLQNCSIETPAEGGATPSASPSPSPSATPAPPVTPAPAEGNSG